MVLAAVFVCEYAPSPPTPLVATATPSVDQREKRERGKREGRCAGVCEISFWNATVGVIDSYSPEDGEGRQVWTE